MQSSPEVYEVMKVSHSQTSLGRPFIDILHRAADTIYSSASYAESIRNLPIQESGSGWIAGAIQVDANLALLLVPLYVAYPGLVSYLILNCNFTLYPIGFKLSRIVWDLELTRLENLIC